MATDRFKEKFIEEAIDLLNSLENALLLLEKDTEEKEQIQSIFRIMHTLKGNSAMFGFHKIDEFTHNLETLYDLIRNNKLKVTPIVLNLTFQSIDHIKLLLNEENDNDPEVNNSHIALTKEIAELVKDPNDKEENTIVNNAEASLIKPASSLFTYHILFEPNHDIMKFGTNPLYLLDDLAQLGKQIAFYKKNNLPSIAEINTEECYIIWEIFLATHHDINAIKDIFIFVEDECKLEINKIADYDILNDNTFLKEITQIGNSDQFFDLTSLIEIANNIRPKEKEENNLEKKSLKEKVVLAKAEKSTSTNQPHARENSISSIRVSSSKLDMLINLVSELITTQARLGLFAESNALAELSDITENMDKISRRLRDIAFNISLIPLESMLTRFQRLIRDVSAELNKEVVFLTEGAETEFDKTIIENIADPIMHILRNSLDHGLESAEERIKIGKPPVGTILLKAFYSGTNVNIEISDDGKGIDPEKIRQAAITKGFISADSQLSQKEILDLIFIPGFSTSKVVTDLSGRGVGMDVVKRKIADVRGEVELNSTLNKGTTITIKLPLTLSIIDGLLVKIDETLYIIPLSVVDMIYAIKHNELKEYNQQIIHNGVSMPFIYLRSYFVADSNTCEEEQVIITKQNDSIIGLVVDSVIGQYQAVLKPLGKLYKNQDFISGASILGDGTIALVMDTNRIIKQFCQKMNEK